MKFPEEFRILTHPSFGTNPGEPFGAFVIRGRYAFGRTLQVIAADGAETGWEHVSVSMPDNKRKTPSWEEMSFVKALFWDSEQAVIQFHPPASEYVNNHAGCLHLWRCVEEMIGHFPLPPAELVGIKTNGGRVIYGGIIFRVVTDNHPGDPKLDSAGPIRTEYVVQLEPLTWGLSRDAAFLFPRHLDAVKVAEAIPHCHAAVCRTENSLPAPVLAELEDSGRIAAKPSALGDNKGEARESTTSKSLVAHSKLRPDSRGGQNLLPEPVRDRTALLATAPGSGDFPNHQRSTINHQRASKRKRMLALRDAAKRTEQASVDETDRTNGTDEADKFWWKQGAYA